MQTIPILVTINKVSCLKIHNRKRIEQQIAARHLLSFATMNIPSTPVTATGSPAAGGLVEVIAPLELQEGYPLQVLENGQTATVLVPAGGVKEGQVFQAPTTPNMATVTQDGAGNEHFIPSGKWRDGLCDCFKFGCCNAMFCLGFCCSPGTYCICYV